MWWYRYRNLNDSIDVFKDGLFGVNLQVVVVRQRFIPEVDTTAINREIVISHVVGQVTEKCKQFSTFCARPVQ